jgi:hypothetical protein
MFALEKYREVQPKSYTGSVPTTEQRNGDFSQTFNSSGKLYTIYDPQTIRSNPAYDPTQPLTLTNPQYVATPFPGNLVPQARIQPIATRVLADIPLPDQSGTVTNANNWFTNDATSRNNFHNLVARLDDNITSAWRLYGRWDHSRRDVVADQWGWGTVASNAGHSVATNDGGVFDVVGTLNAHTILDARIAFNRYVTKGYYTPFDQGSLGFSSALLGQLQQPDRYPDISLTNYTSLGLGSSPDVIASETYSGQAGLLKIVGAHSIKFGTEFRLIHLAQLATTNASGTYAFTGTWTSSNPQVSDPAAGNAVASLLLGDMSSGTATINSTPYLTWDYPVFYFQDDWQVNRRLSLNLGLRWDYEVPPVERHDSQNRGFDFVAQNPYQIPGYDLRGGLLFAGVGGQPRRAFNLDRDNWQPRFGVAYKVLSTKPLVFRAGGGRYFLPTADYGGTMGFSQATSAQPWTSTYQVNSVFANPFPNGLIQPTGAAAGLATGVGNAVTFSNPSKQIPNVWQFSAGFQYELAPGLLLDASYVGSRTRQIQVSQSQDFLTLAQLAMGAAYLSASVPNPLYGVLPSNTTLGGAATVQRSSLLVQYPQFTAVTMNDVSIGESWYNSLQVKAEQRFRAGLSVLFSYTNSKTMEAIQYKNPQDTELSRDLTSFDVPQRVVVSGVYQLPVGPKKRWIHSGLVSRIVGSWQVSSNLTHQSGTPITYPSNYYINGNPKLTSGQTLSHWFNTSPSIWVQRPLDTLRVTPFYSPNIRRQTAPQADANLSRQFRIREGHSMLFKASAYNITNTPIFNVPTTDPTSTLFGVVSPTQMNLPRSIEVGFRYAF